MAMRWRDRWAIAGSAAAFVTLLGWWLPALSRVPNVYG
jgi:hypothetical protein